MTTLFHPFAAIRPHSQQAETIIAPPYDVVSKTRARELTQNGDNQFLKISRSDADLPDELSAYDDKVYQQAADTWQQFLSQGRLKKDNQPCFYVYRMQSDQHQQTGFVALVPTQAIENNQIKKHELTRPVKEDDRVNHITALDAQISPVLLTYRPMDSLREQLSVLTQKPADTTVTSYDGVQHQLWVVNEPELIAALKQQLAAIDVVYVADGHHRTAAALRVAKAQPDNPSAQFCLSILFPADELNILGYHRVIKDLAGLSIEHFLTELQQQFTVNPLVQAQLPSKPTEFSMYLAGQWYQLSYKASTPSDIVEKLDVSILNDYILQPLLGIYDQRRDERIDFIGGRHQLSELQAVVDSGQWSVAFALYPTDINDLLNVADDNRIMPPKSTWFEPKLVDGLVSYRFE